MHAVPACRPVCSIGHAVMRSRDDTCSRHEHGPQPLGTQTDQCTVWRPAQPEIHACEQIACRKAGNEQNLTPQGLGVLGSPPGGHRAPDALRHSSEAALAATTELALQLCARLTVSDA